MAGKNLAMAKRTYSRRIRHSADGINIAADVDAQVEVNSGPAGSSSSSTRQRVVIRQGRKRDQERTPPMSEQDPTALTQDELDAQGAEALPDREAMSLINANVAAPVNVAAALNVLSDDSTAYANAVQDADIDQSN